jgi:hypothetical protein
LLAVIVYDQVAVFLRWRFQVDRARPAIIRGSWIRACFAISHTV